MSRMVTVTVVTGVENRELTEPRGTTVGDIKKKLSIPADFGATLHGDGFNGEDVKDSQILGCEVEDLELEFQQARKTKG